MSSEDLGAIAELCSQLGYPVDAESLSSRFGVLDGTGRDILFVAEMPGRGVVGWVHACEDASLTRGAASEIKGLVVDRSERSRGVGRSLLARAEAWARERGSRDVRVRSRIAREDAHRFYQSRGFRRTKTQHVFEKELD